MAQKIYLKKSSVVDRTPQANSLEFGELTVNYASGNGKSFLAHKKYDGTIAKYHEDTYNESKFATKSELGEVQSSLSSFATKEMLKTASGNAVTSAYTMAKDYVDSAISGLSIGDYLPVASAHTVFTGYTQRFSNIESKLGNYALSATVKSELSAITKTIEDDEYVIAQAFNSHNDRITALENATSGLDGEFLTLQSATSIVSNFNNQVGTAISKANSAFNYTQAVSGTVKATYWDSATTKSKIESASANAYNQAVTYSHDTFVTTDAYVSYTGDVSSQLSQAVGKANSAFNYTAAVSGTVKNGYWDSATTKSKIEAASANSYSQATSYTQTNYVDKTTYNTYTGNVSNDISQAVNKANSAFNYTAAVSGTVKNGYWDSATTKSKIEAASANSYNQATSYTQTNYVDKTTYNTYTGNVSNDISQAVNKANSAFNYTAAVSGTVKAGYWDSATTSSKIGSASGYAYNQAKKYADDNFVKTNTYTAYTGGVSSTLSKLRQDVDYVSGVTSALSANVVTYIDDKLSTVYVYKGSVTNFSNLPESGKVNGYVYNVVNANGNTPAGTNYAWNGTAWDALGGSIDLSGYATTGRVSDLESEISKYTTLSSWTVNNAATHDEVKTASGNAYSLAVASAKSYTDSRLGNVSGSFVTNTDFASYSSTTSEQISAANNLAASAYSYANKVNTALTNNYYTKTDTNTQVANASARTFNSGKTYADNTFLTLTSAATRLSNIDSSISTLKNGLSAWVYTNAATHNEVKTASGNAYSFAVASAKSYTDSRINATSGSFVTHTQFGPYSSSTENKINNVNTALTAFSATVMSDYATETEASSYAAAALGNAMAYTDSKISGLSIGNYLSVASATQIVTDLQNADSQIINKINAVSATVSGNYATKIFVGAASGYSYSKAKTDLIGTTGDAATADTIWGAKNYAKGISGSVVTAIGGLQSDISIINTKLTKVALSATVDSLINNINDTIEENEAVTSAALADLNSRIGNVSGNYLTVASASQIVTNLQNADSQIINKINAVSATVSGNYATKIFVGAASGYSYSKAKTDLIGTANDAATADTIWGAKNYAKAISGSVVTAIGGVQSQFSNYYDKTATNSQIANASARSVNSAVTYANTQIANASARTFNSGKTYADNTFLKITSATSKFSSIDSNISNVNTALTAFSATVVNTYATENDASTYAAAALGNAMAYTDSKISGLSIGNYLSVASASQIVTNLQNADSQIINKITAVSATVSGNYATKIFVGAASGYSYSKAKTDLIGASSDASTADTIWGAKNYAKAISGNVVNSIVGVQSTISILQSSAQTLNNKFTAYTTTTDLQANYATKTFVGSASGYAYNQATAYTKTVSGNIETALNAAKSNITTNATNISTLSGSVVANYATNAKASSYAAAALSNSMDYTDSKIAGLSIGNYLTVSSANSIVTSLTNKITTEHDRIQTVSGTVISLSGEVVSKLTNVYKYMGSVANVASLPNSGKVNGYVYNVVAANGTIGTTGYTPAGTNYAWNGTAWDPLGGTVDLTAYITSASVVSLQTTLTNSITGARNLAQSAYTYANNINTALTNNYYTKTDTNTQVANASARAVTSAVTYADNTFLTKASAGTMYNNITNMLDSLTDFALSATVSTELSGINATMEEAQEVTAAALNDLDTRIRLISTSVGSYLPVSSADTIVTTLNNSIDSIMTSVNSAYNYTDAVSGTIIAGYWDSATTLTKIGVGSGVAYNMATAYTNTVSASIATAITNINSNMTNYVAKTGDTMTGHLNFATDAAAYNSKGLRWGTNKSGIGTDNSGGLGLYANSSIYLRPNVTLGTSSTNGLVISNTAITYNTNTVYHAGNLSPVTTNTVQNITAGKAFASAITATGGVVLQTASTFTNSWRSIPFSNTASPYTNIQWVNANENSGLTYNPFTGKLRAYGFVINGKAATDLLNATGGTTSTTGFVPTTRKVNGHALSADVTVTKADLSLGNVENTALSTWTGNTSIKSVGTITAGTWNGTKIANAYLANNAVAIDGQVVSLGTSATTKNVAQSVSTATTFRPLILGATSNATAANLTAATTGQVYVTAKAYVKPSDGMIHAGGYVIDGKAATDLLNATGGVTTLASITGATAKELSVFENGTKAASYNGTAAVSALTYDKKVGQANNTAANYRPIILGSNNHATAASIPTTSVTGETVFNTGVYVQPSTKKIFAAGFQLTAGTANVLIGDGTSEARSNFATSSITHNEITAATANATKVLTINQNGTQLTTYNGTAAVTANTTDANVKQENNTVATYRPLLMGSTTNATPTSLTATTTGQTYVNAGIYAQPSTGELNAKQMRVNEKVTLQYNSTTEALDFIFS